MEDLINLAAGDAQAAKGSPVIPSTAADMTMKAKTAKALADIQNLAALNLERISVSQQPVAPGRLVEQRPDIPFWHDVCAVKGCQGLCEGQTVTVHPRDAFRDPFANRQPVKPDAEAAQDALTALEEQRLIALGLDRGLLGDLERAENRARHMFGRAEPAHQVTSVVTLPLCPRHANNPEAVRAEGFKNGAVPDTLKGN